MHGIESVAESGTCLSKDSATPRGKLSLVGPAPKGLTQFGILKGCCWDQAHEVTAVSLALGAKVESDEEDHQLGLFHYCMDNYK